MGSSLDDFPAEEETRAMAIKETVAWQVRQAMEQGSISKDEMARRM